MDYIYSIVMGIVQGLTEFLPVSSSGHLTLVQHIFGVDGESNFFFNIMLHVGTLFAVCVFYYKLLWSLIKSFFGLIKKIFTGKFSWKNRTDDENMIFMLIIGLLPLFLLFVPVPGTDMVFKDVSEMFSGNKYLIYVASFLVITSILLWIGIACNKRTCTHAIHSRKDLENEDGRKNYNVLDAICVGVMQVFATLPGISRSGSTLAVGEMRGINKQKAIDYTPEETSLYYYLGLAKYLNKDDAGALEALRKGAANIKEDTPMEISSRIYMISGDILHSMNLPEEAYAAYDSCLNINPNEISCLNNYAYYLSEENRDLKRAEQMSYKTIKAEPENVSYLDTYAWILYMQKRYEEARIYIDQALKNDSTQTSSVIWEHAGDIYIRLGLKSDASNYWQKAIDSGADNATEIRKKIARTKK